MNELANFIGLAAAIISSFAQLPQVIKVLRTGSVKDISLYSQLLGMSASLLFLIYGIMLGLYPNIISGVFNIVCSSIILLMKFRDGTS